jgi:hypothetical protein
MTAASASVAQAPQAKVTDRDRFLFDLQGYLILRGALTEQDRIELLAELNRLEPMNHDDSGWMKPRSDGRVSQPTRQVTPGQVRLNGLLRLSEAFDRLIDYPAVYPYLCEFMFDPQLGNTWSISKERGANTGGWHRGVEPQQYAVRHGRIHNKMLNTVYFLTDNGPDDGCMAALPGGHKSNFDLPWGSFTGLDLPGSIPITGRAGDVLIFSEALLHNGLANTSGRRRSNLYLNFIARDFNVMTYSPEHNYHFAMPPHVRQRFTPQRKAATMWMEFAQTID